MTSIPDLHIVYEFDTLQYPELDPTAFPLAEGQSIFMVQALDGMSRVFVLCDERPEEFTPEQQLFILHPAVLFAATY